ncbi:hypothetical protein Ndes2437A_g04916 [Nannochloris sp. 'desiccata']
MSTQSPQTITYDVASLVSEDFYGYWPSTALASIALALFLIAGLTVEFQIFKAKNRNARYMHLVGITGFIEAAGYVAILWLIDNSGKTNIYAPYVISQTFLILSPNLLQAANYATAGKISLLSGMSNEKRILKPRVLTSTFIGLDVFALVIQAAGITIWATSKGSGEPDSEAITLGSWITVAEFVQGAVLTWPVMDPNTYVISEKEALFYTLDTLPILFCFISFIVYNPANLLPKYLVDSKTGDRLPVVAGDVESGGVVGGVDGVVPGGEEKSIGNNGIKASASTDSSM